MDKLTESQDSTNHEDLIFYLKSTSKYNRIFNWNFSFF